MSEKQEGLLDLDRNKGMEIKIGTMLRSILRERDLTLKEVSQKCGVSISTLHEWENNRAPKNPIQVAKVAQCLGISLHYLLFGFKDPEEALERIIKNEVFSGVYEISLKKVKVARS